MNILILTPVHPTQIEEMGYLFNRWGEDAAIFSPQMLALVWSETEEALPYPVACFAVAEKVKQNPKGFFKKYGKNNLIVYGNLDKATPIKFDYVLAYTSHLAEDENDWDKYLTEAQHRLQNTTMPKITWFNHSDAEYTFPTLHHLNTFLRVLKLKENTNGYLQS